MPGDFKLEISVTLQPIKNEYQNFGVMQAQDMINVALFIKADPPFKPATDIDELPVVLVGSSHGACDAFVIYENNKAIYIMLYKHYYF